MKRFVILDTHAIIHRAYHALPPLTTPSGEPVQAAYGFTTMLMRILAELKPDYLAAAFDMPGPTFRHAAYERYKAHRPKAPSDLVSQFAIVREIAAACDIPVLAQEGYEADDIIGTVAAQMKKKKGIEVVVVTGDMDALQLVRTGLKVYTMRKGIADTVIYDEDAVRSRYGFGPEQLVDYKGLRGDPSDNIPGVAGIGEKTATDLIKTFGSIDGILRALRKGDKRIPDAVAGKLKAGEEDAKFSRELATIRRDVPITVRLEDAAWLGMRHTDAVRALFTRLGFLSLLKRLDGAPAEGKKTKAEGGGHPMIGMPGGDVYVCDERLAAERPDPETFSRDGWYAYDAKNAIRFFRSASVALGDVAFDVMLAAYVAQEAPRDFSYRAIAAREVGRHDAGPDALFRIADALDKKLEEGKLRFVFEKIEMPLAPILADMEDQGIMIDRPFLERLGRNVAKKIRALTADIYKAAGEEFNIASPRQLSRILFEKLGLPVRGLRKTEKGGVVSTRESELEKLRRGHAIVEDILAYRELAKLASTYIDVLPKLADEGNRLHTTFNQAATATGRLSSANPNLQNIPILSETGREIRKAFVASPGYALASFDYSQIELRIAAHMAQDEKMIASFRRGEDIHRMTAAAVYNVAPEDVTPELRRQAKTLNFGVLYGMGAGAFAEATGMGRDDADRFIEEYFSEFAGIREYIKRTKSEARERGYVESLFGRRRYIPEIAASNARIRSEAERMAVNMPIQATATGDIIKMAMIAAEAWIRKEKLQDDARLLLQVHDELVFEIRENVAERVSREIKRIMERAAKLDVPLVVDAKIGPNWAEQKILKHEI